MSDVSSDSLIQLSNWQNGYLKRTREPLTQAEMLELLNSPSIMGVPVLEVPTIELMPTLSEPVPYGSMLMGEKESPMQTLVPPDWPFSTLFVLWLFLFLSSSVVVTASMLIGHWIGWW